MNPSSESLRRRLRELARPRPFGSAQEAETGRKVAEALRRAGWSVSAEPFTASLTIDAVTPPGLAAAAFLLIAATATLKEVPLLAASSACLFLGLSAVLDRLAEALLGRSVAAGRVRPGAAQGVNLRATHPALAGPGPRLWIAAHLDAKRQTLPLVVRCAAALLARAVGALSALVVLAYLLWPSPALLAAQRATFVLAGLGALTLLVNSSDGETNGAVDNAGSLAALLEVAGKIGAAPRAAAGLRLELVATSGEEMGCLGAMALASSLAGEGDKPAVLNLEALGAGGRLLLIASGRKRSGAEPSLAGAVSDLASRRGSPFWRWPLAPGFWTDQRPFLRAGCEAVTLCGFGRGVTAIHTRGDREEKIDLAALEEQTDFVLALVSHL